MELLLIRHGLPIRRELEEGAADPELSDAGHAQAQHLAEYLSSETLDAVYASPLRRAVQTAEPLAASQGREIVLVDDVAEWDRHSNEYVPIEELKAANDPRWQAMLRGEWTVHEESPEQFRERIVRAVETLIDTHSGNRIAIVCHGGVINAYASHVLGLDFPLFFQPTYTSINRFLASSAGHRSVASLNEAGHLVGVRSGDR